MLVTGWPSRPRRGDDPPPAAALVPQSLVMARQCHPPTCTPRRERDHRSRASCSAAMLYADGEATLLFCDNDTNVRRLFGVEGVTGHFKDAFHEYVVGGRQDVVNPARHGTKAGVHYQVEIPAHGSALSSTPGPGHARAPVCRLRRGGGAATRRRRCVLRRAAGRARQPRCARSSAKPSPA